MITGRGLQLVGAVTISAMLGAAVTHAAFTHEIELAYERDLSLRMDLETGDTDQSAASTLAIQPIPQSGLDLKLSVGLVSLANDPVVPSTANRAMRMNHWR